MISCFEMVMDVLFFFFLVGGDNVDKYVRSYGWWVGRTYQPMYYWGGAAPGSGKCSCGLEEKGCVGSSSTCNCDAGLNEQMSDKGMLNTFYQYLNACQNGFVRIQGC